MSKRSRWWKLEKQDELSKLRESEVGLSERDGKNERWRYKWHRRRKGALPNGNEENIRRRRITVSGEGDRPITLHFLYTYIGRNEQNLKMVLILENLSDLKVRNIPRK